MRARVLLSIAMAGALIAVPQQVTHAQREKQPFCLQSPTGSMNCTYDSLEQCQQILGGRSVSGTCVANPAWSETTGTGGSEMTGAGGASSPDRPPDSRDHPPSPAR
jgi:Protein of unknown function (DUF3551)